MDSTNYAFHALYHYATCISLISLFLSIFSLFVFSFIPILPSFFLSFFFIFLALFLVLSFSFFHFLLSFLYFNRWRLQFCFMRFVYCWPVMSEIHFVKCVFPSLLTTCQPFMTGQSKIQKKKREINMVKQLKLTRW